MAWLVIGRIPRGEIKMNSFGSGLRSGVFGGFPTSCIASIVSLDPDPELSVVKCGKICDEHGGFRGCKEIYCH